MIFVQFNATTNALIINPQAISLNSSELFYFAPSIIYDLTNEIYL